jgi:nitroreductase
VTLPDRAAADLLLSTTRAVRRRLDLERPVDPATVRECLELAVQAPTGGAVERWRWLLVADPATKQAVADLYREVAAAPFRDALDQAQTPTSQKAYDGALQLADTLERVPLIVFPCMLGRPPETPYGAAGFYGSIIPAVWSFMLALRSRGLGSTYTTAHLRAEQRFAELLGIPADVTQIAMLPVAHTLGTSFRPAARGPVEEIIYVDRWSAPARPSQAAP